MNILLVEDSETLQYQFTKFLEEAGHSVVVASSGEKAIQLMELSPIELIICDVEMPGLNGYETVSIIRESLADNWIPIMIATNLSSNQDCLKGFEAGADDYLVKPISKELLHAKIGVMERFILIYQNSKIGKNNALSQQQNQLTGFTDYPMFLERAELQWAILSRQHLPASFLVVKIDRFVDYKQSCGNKASKKCLKEVSEAIKLCVRRPGDIVAKMNDEEFIVMLTDTGKVGAASVAKNICRSVEKLNIEYKQSSSLDVITVSVGGSTCIRLREQSILKTIDLAKTALKYVNTYFGNDYKIMKFDTMKCSGVETRADKSVFTPSLAEQTSTSKRFTAF
ncbi:response regulator [Aliikangiella sp. IMCC44359]|uniref:response regulator n=1 Tax=Aliikangiella sp. IMCC44359 TaxID=3459125 RepID=UPI00403B23F3